MDGVAWSSSLTRGETHTMMRRTRSTMILGAVILLASTVVGCAGTSDEATTPRPQVTPGDFANNMRSCLSEAGYDVTVYDDGSIGIKLPDSQMPAYDDATHECSVKFGYDKMPNLTTDQRADLYDQTMALVDCLEEQGYPITDVPSKQAFIDGTEFVPYEQVPTTVVGDAWDKLQRVCPQPR